MNKCAIVAISGRPNTGKSSILNAMLGAKVAIVSPKPQTTRSRITGVLTRGECQLVFMDTPGLHKARSKLADKMVRTALETVTDVDLALLVAEPADGPGIPEKMLIKRFDNAKVPVVAVINKVDAVPKATLLPVMDAYAKAYDFKAIVPVSARTGDGMDDLLKLLEDLAPVAEHIFPDDELTDQTERTLAAEFLREKFLRLLDREVPHGIAVVTENFVERPDGMVDIDLVIYCEKQSHKGIIIGHQGDMLKKAGEEARKDIEELLGTKVYMQMWVRVKDDWRNNDYLLKSFGYE